METALQQVLFVEVLFYLAFRRKIIAVVDVKEHKRDPSATELPGSSRNSRSFNDRLVYGMGGIF